MKKITSEQIIAARRDLCGLAQKYLTQQGWKESYDYPDSHWRWEKRVTRGGQDKTMTLRMDDAFDMERKFLDA